MYDVILLAGGALESDFQPHYTVETKAYLPLGKRMMIEYVIDALRSVDRLGDIVLVAPSPSVPDVIRKSVAHVATGGNSLIESLKSGLKGLSSRCRAVLVVPSDTPLLTGEAIDDFLCRCERREADMYYSFLSKKDSDEKYPHLHHTCISLREGVFCGGSLIVFPPRLFDACEKLFSRISRARKNPLHIAGILGFRVISRLLTRTLSVKDLEERFSALLGAQAVGIQTHFAEVGFNVDELSSLRRAEGELVKREELKNQVANIEGLLHGNRE